MKGNRHAISAPVSMHSLGSWNSSTCIFSKSSSCSGTGGAFKFIATIIKHQATTLACHEINLNTLQQHLVCVSDYNNPLACTIQNNNPIKPARYNFHHSKLYQFIVLDKNAKWLPLRNAQVIMKINKINKITQNSNFME